MYSNIPAYLDLPLTLTAGGYDAIFCIVLSADAARGVERVWQSWTEMSVGPLLAKEDFVGARVEKVEDVAGFNKVI